MNEMEYARLETSDGEPVMLKGVKATGDLKGLLFEARVEQQFSNPTETNLEVVYTFPIPYGAVLLGVDVQLGDKKLSGSVVEKKQAEARYEEAMSEGNAAIMLEKNHDGSFTLNLGNLAAKEDCLVTIRYSQALQFEQHGLRLLIPTVIAPRFGDAVLDGGLQPHQAPVHSLLAEYAFNIELRLHGDLARARVASPSHPVGISHSAVGGSSILTVSLGRNSSLDRDFVLVVDQLAQESIAVLARDMVVSDHVVALASFCPRIKADGPATTAVKILVDCSGSMGGDSIQAAKRSLQAIVLQFAKGDKFSLSRFGSSVEHRSRGLWSATETTRLAAQRWVGDLQADLGGTEMEAALTSTFALSQTVSSDVLLVTDGEINAIDKTIEAAKHSNHRIFVVGIGSSPAEGHLRRLAEATGGACDFVAPGEAVEPAILRMFARLRSPRLADLKVVWSEGITPEWTSDIPLSVFDGDTINLYAVFKAVPVGNIKVLAKTSGDQSAPIEIGCAEFGKDVDSNDSLSRMVAAVRMKSKVIGGLVGTQTVATKLAVDYQLVTEHTNFLLIHERAEEAKPLDMPTLHKVSQMVPAGWGASASVGNVCSQVMFSNKQSVGDADLSISYSRRSASTSPPFDVPMFKRKQDSGIRFSRREVSSESDEIRAGKTPLSLSNWLRSTPELQWPKTYQELRDIALDKWVIEWLEISVERTFGSGLTERIVVASFLRVMASWSLKVSSGESPGSTARVKGFLSKVVEMMAPQQVSKATDPLGELEARIISALEGTSDTSWPDTVFSLEGTSA